MKLIFSPLAEKQLKKIPKTSQVILAKKVRSLREGNLAGTEKLKLRGYKNFFRARVGNYRVIFKISSTGIYVVILGHRKEIYKLLDRILK